MVLGEQMSTHLCITHQTQSVTRHPACAQVMFLNEDISPLQKESAVKDTLKTSAVLDHTCTKANKEELKMNITLSPCWLALLWMDTRVHTPLGI